MVLDHNQYIDGLTLLFFCVSEMVEKDFGHDTQARMALEKLLVRDKSTGITTRFGFGGAVVSFVSREKLHSLLVTKKPFDLRHISKTLEVLIQTWARRHVVPQTTPTLTRLNYNPASNENEIQPMRNQESEKKEKEVLPLPLKPQHSTGQVVDDNDHDENEENESPPPPRRARMPKRKHDENDTANLAKLTSARRNLHNDGGIDPMQEILAKAASARRRMPNKTTAATASTMYDKKPSAKQVQFFDSESEEDEEGVQLSDLPIRDKLLVRVATASPAAVSSPRNHGKRMRFSEDEKRAIREGVRKFGVGKWSYIKSEYAIILKNRTTINIKVRKKGDHGYVPNMPRSNKILYVCYT